VSTSIAVVKQASNKSNATATQAIPLFPFRYRTLNRIGNSVQGHSVAGADFAEILGGEGTSATGMS
jgi:hypothetical protein